MPAPTPRCATSICPGGSWRTSWAAEWRRSTPGGSTCSPNLASPNLAVGDQPGDAHRAGPDERRAARRGGPGGGGPGGGGPGGGGGAGCPGPGPARRADRGGGLGAGRARPGRPAPQPAPAARPAGRLGTPSGPRSPGWSSPSTRHAPRCTTTTAPTAGGRAAVAVGVVLAHCARTGRAYWAWSAWEWARLAGASIGEFRAAQPAPTEHTVRPFLIALAWLLGGFTDFQHLGAFNRLLLARLVFGASRSSRRCGGVGELLEQWGYRADPPRAGLAGSGQPGTADQPQPPAGGPEHRRVRPAPRTPGHGRPRPAAALSRCSAWSPPSATARPRRAQRTTRARRSPARTPRWTAWVERWHATSTLTPNVRAHHPQQHGQGRALAGRRAPRDHRAGPVDPPDLRGLGRGGGPDVRRRPRPAPRRGRRPRRRARSPRAPRPHLLDGHPHLLPRLPGVGVVPPPVRPGPRAGRCPAASPR